MGGRREPFTPEATVSPRMSVLECGCALDGHREGGRRLSRQGPVRALTEGSAAQNQPACVRLKGQALACGGWAGVGYCLVTRGSSAKAGWGPVPGVAGALLPRPRLGDSSWPTRPAEGGFALLKTPSVRLTGRPRRRAVPSRPGQGGAGQGPMAPRH